MCLRVGDKFSKNSGAFHLTEILGVRWHGIGQESFSGIKGNLLHLAPFTTKKEAQYLLGLFGFWK